MAVNLRNGHWGPNIINDGLILYVDANNEKSYSGNGSTTWVDLMKPRNNGDMVNGPTYSVDLNVPNILFDGVDDEVQISPPIDSSIWTLSYWFKYELAPNKLVRQLLQHSNGVVWMNSSFSTYAGIHQIVSFNNNDFLSTSNMYKYRDEAEFGIQRINHDGTMGPTFSINREPFGAISIRVAVDSDEITGYYAGTNFGNLRKINVLTGATILNTPQPGNSTLSGNPAYLDEVNDHLYFLGGFVTLGTYSCVRIGRYNTSDLTVDPTFDSTTGFNNTPRRAILDSNDKLYVTGLFTTYKGSSSPYIIRLNNDGSIDTSFDVGTGFNNNKVFEIVLDSNDLPIIIGDFTSYNGTGANRIVRLTATGSVDTSFVYGTGFNTDVRGISYDYTLDRVYIVGDFSSYNGTAAKGITCLSITGSIVGSFSYGTGLINKNGSPTIHNVHVRKSDEKVMVGIGQVNTDLTYTTTYNGSHTFSNFLLLNKDGTVDTSLDADDGFTQGTHRDNLYLENDGVLLTNYPGQGTRVQLDIFTAYYNGQWHQATITLDDSNVIKQYDDGVLRKTTSISNNVEMYDIAKIKTIDNLSSFQIYNRDLSGEEVKHNYDIMKSRFGHTQS